MPRPTPTQLVYGSTTVVLSTLLLLLLSDAHSGIAVALAVIAGLALGTFATVAASSRPRPLGRPTAERRMVAVGGAEPRDRVRQHSLRR